MRHGSIRNVRVRRWGPMVASAVALLGSASCADKDRAARAPSEAMPATVAVDGGEVTLGHATGSLRKTATLQSFEITQNPVTVHQYRQCVASHSCDAPVQEKKPSIWKSTYSEATEAQELPMVGISADAAAQYCAWVGGKLPTYPQWLAAARGPKVVRYAWGDTNPTCETHFAELKAGQVRCCGGECDRVRVRQHAAGASPTGVEDVLLVPGGELVAKGEGAGALTCAAEGGRCVAGSVRRGSASIDSLQAAPKESKNFGFRCVWSD